MLARLALKVSSVMSTRLIGTGPFVALTTGMDARDPILIPALPCLAAFHPGQPAGGQADCVAECVQGRL